MDGVKEEPPANEEEDDGRGAWNTVQLGVSLDFFFIYLTKHKSQLILLRNINNPTVF